jgi:hypothetical protein
MIPKAKLEIARMRAHFGEDISYLTFYARNGKIIENSRLNERHINEIVEQAINGPRSSTRKNLNARVRHLLPTHDRVKAHTKIIDQVTTITVQFREVRRPHLLMFSSELLDHMHRFVYDDNTMIEGLIFGSHHRHEASIVDDGFPPRPINYPTTLEYVPYYEELEDEEDDDTSFISDEVPTDREYMISFGITPERLALIDTGANESMGRHARILRSLDDQAGNDG